MDRRNTQIPLNTPRLGSPMPVLRQTLKKKRLGGGGRKGENESERASCNFNGFEVTRGSHNFRLPSVCLKYFTSCLFFVNVCIHRRPPGVGGRFMIYHMF